MSGVSLLELRKAAAERLFMAATPGKKKGEWGVPVHLERRDRVPTLITTAEAVCALAPLRRDRKQDFEKLVNGLSAIWKGYTKDELHHRHRGWYLLAMIAAERDADARAVAEEILALRPEQGALWPDSDNRKHEIYSSWIITWALVSAVDFFSTRSFRSAAELRTVASESVENLLKVLQPVAEEAKPARTNRISVGEIPRAWGAPFTARSDTPDRLHESRPNPAMTAYLLSLLAQCPRVLNKPSLENELRSAYRYLQQAANKGIWDSYREPYQPNSAEGDFEHFTTCWVARAFWEGLRGFRPDAAGINEPLPREWLWTLARALRALTTTLQADSPIRDGTNANHPDMGPKPNPAKGVGEPAASLASVEGMIYVDRGSPRDYSFAIADFLMLLNSIASAELPNLLPADELFARLLATAEIDLLIHNVAELRSLSLAYSDYEQLVGSQRKRARKTAADLAEAKAELEQIKAKLALTKSALTREESQLKIVRVSNNKKLRDLRRSTGGSLAVLVFTGYDLAGFVAGALTTVFHHKLASFLERQLEITAEWAGFLVSTLCLWLLVPLVVASVTEIRRASKLGTTSLLHVALPIALFPLLLASGSTAFQALKGASGFGDMLPLLGVLATPWLGRAMLNLHKKLWARIETAVADKGAVTP